MKTARHRSARLPQSCKHHMYFRPMMISEEPGVHPWFKPGRDAGTKRCQSDNVGTSLTDTSPVCVTTEPEKHTCTVEPLDVLESPVHQAARPWLLAKSRDGPWCVRLKVAAVATQASLFFCCHRVDVLCITQSSHPLSSVAPPGQGACRPREPGQNSLH